LFTLLRNQLDDKTYAEDEERLNKRLLLREKDRCVVGIIPEEDLFKLIKEKTNR